MRAAVALLAAIGVATVMALQEPLRAGQGLDIGEPCPAAFPEPPIAPNATSAMDDLGRYESGDYLAAFVSVRTAADLAAAYQTLSRNAGLWIGDGTAPGVSAHRRLTAAAFALEIAGHKLSDEDANGRLARWTRCQLVAWGGAALTMRVPTRPDGAPRPDVSVQAGERAWFLAAIAVLEWNGWDGLIDSQIGLGLPPATYPLVPLALARFPNEPRLLLARAMAEEHFGWPFAPGRARLAIRDEVLDPDLLLARMDSAATDHPDTRRDRLLHDALRDFEKLTASEAVGPEAHRRAGYVQLALGDRTNARKHFVAADRAGADDSVRYVSRLLTGWSFERDRRPVDAERAYRAALDICPRAPSASTLLGALLFIADRPSEVPSLLEATLKTKDALSDPWDAFTAIDAERVLPALIAGLRAELR